VILGTLGLACLAIGAWLLYLQMPREAPLGPAWLRSDSGSTVAALGCFTLLVAGVVLIVKAVA